MPLMHNSPKIFSLRQVVSSIRKTLEERYQRTYWVKAEMHKMNHYPSGHAYPELVQKENGKTVAQINGTIWKHNFKSINEKFIGTVKEPLKEGTTLLLQVKISFHETYGLSLHILDIDPSYTLGELQKERQETLLKLQQLGIINANQQLDYPLLPKRIAVISADASKGLSDFMQILQQNEWGYHFFTHLFPAYLQGDAAVTSIQQQLERIEKVKHHFDVVVIVRGGGGEVGMSCYNNFELCQKIASFSLPILTGIGHSTNMTVAEMIAFRNAITPTELGEFLLQSFHEFSQPVYEASKNIRRSSAILLENAKNKFDFIAKNFKLFVQQQQSKNNSKLLEWSRKLEAKSELLLQQNEKTLEYAAKNIEQSSVRLLKTKQEDVLNTFFQIGRMGTSWIERQKEQLKTAERHINFLDPKRVLHRGYSIVRHSDKVISKKNKPKKGAKLDIETFDYQIVAEINTLAKKEE